eukprot:m.210544 g.210544  ORF g.210544 m.210544 type:complete len:78 (+) comp17144_c0_seq6:3218-3451(+)
MSKQSEKPRCKGNSSRRKGIHPVLLELSLQCKHATVIWECVCTDVAYVAVFKGLERGLQCTQLLPCLLGLLLRRITG